MTENGRNGTLRVVVDASLAPPAWMGPVDAAAEATVQAQKEKGMKGLAPRMPVLPPRALIA